MYKQYKVIVEGPHELIFLSFFVQYLHEYCDPSDSIKITNTPKYNRVERIQNDQKLIKIDFCTSAKFTDNREHVKEASTDPLHIIKKIKQTIEQQKASKDADQDQDSMNDPKATNLEKSNFAKEIYDEFHMLCDIDTVQSCNHGKNKSSENNIVKFSDFDATIYCSSLNFEIIFLVLFMELFDQNKIEKTIQSWFDLSETGKQFSAYVSQYIFDFLRDIVNSPRINSLELSNHPLYNVIEDKKILNYFRNSQDEKNTKKYKKVGIKKHYKDFFKLLQQQNNINAIWEYWHDIISNHNDSKNINRPFSFKNNNLEREFINFVKNSRQRYLYFSQINHLLDWLQVLLI
jgi:hypothetical protein